MQKIAVWNPAFLGDVILTIPMIRMLKAALPEASIDFYVIKGVEPLLTAQPELDNVFAFDKRGSDSGLTGLRYYANQVASRKYDLFISVHRSLRSVLISRLSGAKQRIGYTEATLSKWFFTDLVDRNFGEYPEIERIISLLDPLEIPDRIITNPGLQWPELRLPIEAQTEADQLLAPLPPGPMLAVHPGSAWATKRWTSQGFAYVIRKALDYGANVVLLDAESEADYLHEIKQLAKVEGARRFLDLTGKSSLPGLAAIIARAQCFLGNDSAPTHLAWAQHVPVTAIFGPTTPDLGFAPLGNSKIIEVQEECRPCGRHGHKHCPQDHFHCMTRIDPALVWEDVQNKLYPWKSGAEERKSQMPGQW